jgi:hypothetical protein
MTSSTTTCIHCGEDIFYVGGYTCWVDMLQRDYCPNTESAHEPPEDRKPSSDTLHSPQRSQH